MSPAVSVITPTYNRANFLKKSIQSVLRQTFGDFEIIVINNYSDDNTLEVVNSFNDDRIKIINFKNEGIIAKSRNQGIMNSSGRYIAFLDDDDLWCPDKLELQVKYLESNPDFGLVYSNALIIDEHDNRKGLLINPKQAKTGSVFLNLLTDTFIPALTVLMRRGIVETNGLFNEEPCMRAAEDYEYWLRASLKFDFGYIDKPLALYRVHSGGASKAINRPLLRQKVLQSFFNNSDVPEKYYNKLIYNIERLNADISVYYWSVSDKINARKCARRYISSSLEKIQLFNVFIGFLLYIVIYFRYDFFKGIIKHAARIRKTMDL